MKRTSQSETFGARGALRRLARDPASVAVAAAMGALYLAWLGPAGATIGNIHWLAFGCLLVLVVRLGAALRRSRPTGPAASSLADGTATRPEDVRGAAWAGDDDERRFWRDLWLALLVWAGVAAARATFEGGSSWIDGSQALVYILVSIAAERQVHRPAAWRPDWIEKAIRWPALGFFVLALTHYLVLLPWRHGVSEVSSRSWLDPALAFFLALGLFVALRWATLSRVARGLRWRFVYGALSAAFFFEVLAKIVRRQVGRAQAAGLGPSDPASSTAASLGESGAPLFESAAAEVAVRLGAGGLTLLPFLLVGLAIGLSRLPWSAISDRAKAPGLPFSGSRLGDLAEAGGGATIAWCLFFPVLHVFLHRAALVDPALRVPRETLVVVATSVLGLAAWLEQRYQQSRVGELWREQQGVEGELRTQEQDLRLMVERERSRAEIERSQQKFASAFRASPDGLAIADLHEGRLLDVNPSFCRLFDLEQPESSPDPATPAEPATVFGSEIGLWADDEALDALAHRLHREGSVRGLGPSVGIPKSASHASGESGEVLSDSRIRLAFELIQSGPRPMVLILARVLAESELASWRFDEDADVVVGARAAIVATDRGDRVVSWSRGATELFGVDGRQAVGQLLDDPDMPGAAPRDGGGPPCEPAYTVGVLDARGVRTGRLRFYRSGDEPSGAGSGEAQHDRGESARPSRSAP